MRTTFVSVVWGAIVFTLACKPQATPSKQTPSGSAKTSNSLALASDQCAGNFAIGTTNQTVSFAGVPTSEVTSDSAALAKAMSSVPDDLKVLFFVYASIEVSPNIGMRCAESSLAVDKDGNGVPVTCWHVGSDNKLIVTLSSDPKALQAETLRAMVETVAFFISPAIDVWGQQPQNQGAPAVIANQKLKAAILGLVQSLKIDAQRNPKLDPATVNALSSNNSDPNLADKALYVQAMSSKYCNGSTRRVLKSNMPSTYNLLMTKPGALGLDGDTCDVPSDTTTDSTLNTDDPDLASASTDSAFALEQTCVGNFADKASADGKQRVADAANYVWNGFSNKGNGTSSGGVMSNLGNGALGIMEVGVGIGAKAGNAPYQGLQDTFDGTAWSNVKSWFR